MHKLSRRLIYRILCGISLILGLYLIIDLLLSKTLDIRLLIVFILLISTIIWGVLDWKRSSDMIRKQERELKNYQLYIQPLEELVKEIRARQHEFDNHIHAILNMHVTVDNYEELVEKQSQYIKDVKCDSASKYLPLLRISDKVLAGFLYSKILASPENVSTEIQVKSWQIISGIPEHLIIEVIGVLVDNAYQACEEKGGNVRISLDSANDKVMFEIWNEYRKISFEEIGHFFENGYSTKGKQGRGIGLYRAKSILEKSGGEITVSQECLEEKNYLHFKVVI